MSHRYLILAALLAACSSKREPARDNPQPPASSPAVALPVPSGDYLGFVPDVITARLGHSRAVAALDLRAFKAAPLLALIPERFACARDLLKYMGVAVVALDDSGHAVLYATQLSEVGTKRCLDDLAPLVGAAGTVAADGSYHLDFGGENLSLGWHAGVLTVHESDEPVPAPTPADAELHALMKYVPAEAPGFLLIKTTPDQSLGSVVAWLHVDASSAVLTARVEGATAGLAHAWVSDFVRGLKEGANEKHVVIEDAWFKEVDTDRVATIEARIPFSIFQPVHPR